jgi:hypothetical protein
MSSPPEMLLTRAAIVFVFVSSFVLLSRGPVDLPGVVLGS